MKIFYPALFLLLLSSGCRTAGVAMKPLEVVPHVDVKRYLGSWHEIARYPNRFQKGCVDSQADYRLLGGGDIRVVNTCRQGSPDGRFKSAKGKAWIVDKTTNAKLKVRFFWPFSGDYWIIDLGEHYEYAVVGEPGRKYLWILSRRKTMDRKTYDEILGRLAEKGYDPAKLIINPGSVS
jgi:apolipoprotein D and lipocalin family protein